MKFFEEKLEELKTKTLIDMSEGINFRLTVSAPIQARIDKKNIIVFFKHQYCSACYPIIFQSLSHAKVNKRIE